jgi:RecA-family ATPase
VKDASTDPKKVRENWALHPFANIAIACGAVSQIVVVEDDSAEARAELAALESKHGRLPPTAKSKTLRGHHRYLSIPNGVRVPHKGQKRGSPLEVISDGHYVVAPPSIHPSRIRYQWVDDVTDFAEAPDWLIRYAIEMSDRTDSPEVHREKGEARIRDALRFLSSDKEEYWFHRAAEIESLKWGEKGYAILDDWSKTTTGDNYNPHQNRKRWDALKADHENKRTIGSLFYEAKQNGWDEDAFERAWESQKPNPQPLDLFRGDELLSAPAPPRHWLVESWIPAGETTMLGGDGGTGKTTLALQLGVAAVSGQNWLERKVDPCTVLYVSAEDPKDEIHFRLEQITKHLKITKDELAQLKLIDLAGKDSTLATFDKNGLISQTPLFWKIEEAAREQNTGCIIFDAVADFFGGNENERREVRAFIGLLRGLALRLRAAVVFIAHPSVDAIKTGRGYSGSTHWNNAVRSRLYFTDAPNDGDGPINPDLRVIELAKSNRARRGEKIDLMWTGGRFVTVTLGLVESLTNETEAESVFLKLLKRHTKQGGRVSPYTSNNYAPSVLAQMPGAKGLGKASLARAMHRLIEKGAIRIEEFGPPSKLRHRIIIEPGGPTD